MKNQTNKKTNESEVDFIWTSGIITVLIFGLWAFTWWMLKDKNPVERGTFGDMFGSINALFSGLALSGIILTILLQRKELKLQREELASTRLEFHIQNETLKLQRFENTFFSLLDLHHGIVSGIDYRYYKRKERRGWKAAGQEPTTEEMEAVTINGRDVFRHRFNLLLKELNDEPARVNDIYMKHYGDAQTDFGHYFRNLYRIIKFVHETEFNSEGELNSAAGDVESESSNQYVVVNHEVRYKYTSMIRAQLSDYELLWIFYNCLSMNGKEKFKPLIERYSLLKNLPMDKIHSDLFSSHYEKSAFQRRSFKTIIK